MPAEKPIANPKWKAGAVPLNRIVGHTLVRAKDLVLHELNPRLHTDDQRKALRAIYKEVGYARSVLVYQLRDGRYKVIDGHLRISEHDPDDEIPVEVLDVTDEEARKLLLTIDPLAQLATYSDGALLALNDITKSDDEYLRALWAGLHQADAQELLPKEKKEDEKKPATNSSKFLVIIDCNNEGEQAMCLVVCQSKGWAAKSLTS